MKIMCDGPKTLEFTKYQPNPPPKQYVFSPNRNKNPPLKLKRENRKVMLFFTSKIDLFHNVFVKGILYASVCTVSHGSIVECLLRFLINNTEEKCMFGHFSPTGNNVTC
jgi:hypothetical protein